MLNVEKDQSAGPPTAGSGELLAYWGFVEKQAMGAFTDNVQTRQDLICARRRRQRLALESTQGQRHRTSRPIAIAIEH